MRNRIRAAYAVLRGRPVIANATFAGPALQGLVIDHDAKVLITGNHFRGSAG